MFLRVLISSFIILAGCASQPQVRSDAVEPIDQSEYTRLIGKNTAKTSRYSGFYQTFQADVTILTVEVQTSGLRRKAQLLQWSPGQYQGERDKVLQEAGAYAKFFLRFFSPDKEHDDLSKSKSIWKVYLDYGGSRFEGQVKKLSDKLIELQTLYPHMDRFSTPYEITFNVPMNSVEQGPGKVTLTSSLGTAEFSFPNGRNNSSVKDAP
ncbi:MAG: hypothetical protein HC902_11595, partial [Calothrix sp. SM1_5_4]|nr:hypothetical protein [Calothrix sp. SM1_5_4]